MGSVFQNPRSQFFCLDTTSEVAFGCENMGLSKDEIKQRIAKWQETENGNLMGRNILKLSVEETGGVCFGIGNAAGDICLRWADIQHGSRCDWRIKKTLLFWKNRERPLIQIVEHRLYWLKHICDRVIYMEEGHIIIGSADENICYVFRRPDQGELGDFI